MLFSSFHFLFHVTLHNPYITPTYPELHRHLEGLEGRIMVMGSQEDCFKGARGFWGFKKGLRFSAGL